jgi:hypothetical protein
MARRSRPNRFEKELEALRPALADPDSPASHAILRTALNRSGSFVAAKAAAAIREHLLGGFEEDLKAAFERFMKDSVKTDPGCKAKLAALEALDYLESLDPAPFLTALRYFQKEPGWGSAAKCMVLGGCADLDSGPELVEQVRARRADRAARRHARPEGVPPT